VPGIYIRNDAYHYDGTVDATILNGRVQLGVEEKYLADIFAATYVTSARICVSHAARLIRIGA
jgi:hypothetical protein